MSNRKNTLHFYFQIPAETFTGYGPEFTCFWLSEGFKYITLNYSIHFNSYEVLPQKQLEYHQKSVTRPVMCGVFNKQTKQPLFPQTLCFGLSIHWTGYIYRFSGSGHTGRISFTQFCVCFVSDWYAPVSLFKHCPCRLLPDLCKPIIKFPSCSAPNKSVRSHLAWYQMMAPPVPYAKHCITV